jgi:hypothetical protein
MTFRWGGLSDTTDGLGMQEPPADGSRHRSTIDVVGYEKYDIDKHDDGSVLISTVLTERFTGAIEGTGRADHIRLVHTDGTGISTGIERIEGSVDGRAGAFVLTAHGRNHGQDRVTGTWTVQRGSGTGELVGLRGRGTFTAVADADGRWRADDEFVYWFEN